MDFDKIFDVLLLLKMSLRENKSKISLEEFSKWSIFLYLELSTSISLTFGEDWNLILRSYFWAYRF